MDKKQFLAALRRALRDLPKEELGSGFGKRIEKEIRGIRSFFENPRPISVKYGINGKPQEISQIP